MTLSFAVWQIMAQMRITCGNYFTTMRRYVNVGSDYFSGAKRRPTMLKRLRLEVIVATPLGRHVKRDSALGIVKGDLFRTGTSLF